MKSCRLVTCVEIVEEQVVPYKPLISVLRGKTYTMVGIPEGAQRFVDVAGARMSREYACVLHRIVLVIPVQGTDVLTQKKVAGKTVALRWCVAIMKVPGCRREPKASVLACGR